MASCNDCICSEVCYYKAFNDERILKKRRDDVEKICKSFVRRDSLKNTATADAVEVVHGRWRCHGDCGVTECSVCGWSIEEYVGDYAYCPNCGTRMNEEVKHER